MSAELRIRDAIQDSLNTIRDQQSAALDELIKAVIRAAAADADVEIAKVRAETESAIQQAVAEALNKARDEAKTALAAALEQAGAEAVAARTAAVKEVKSQLQAEAKAFISKSIGEARAHIERARAEAEQARERTLEATNEAEQARREAEESRKAAGEARKAADEARSDLERAKADAEHARGELEQARGEAVQARVEAERARTEAEAASGTSDRVRRQLEEAREELQTTGGALEEARRDAAQARKALEQAQVDVEQSRAELDQALSDVAEARGEVDRARDEAHTSRQAGAPSETGIVRLAESIRALDEARALTEVFDALVTHASREADRAAILIVRSNQLQGWKFAGFGSGAPEPRSVALKLDRAGVVAEAVREKRTRTTGPESSAFAFAQLPTGRVGMVVPLEVGGQTVAVLYADDATREQEGTTASWTAGVEVLARHAARCLEMLTVQHTSGAKPSKSARPASVAPEAQAAVS